MIFVWPLYVTACVGTLLFPYISSKVTSVVWEFSFCLKGCHSSTSWISRLAVKLQEFVPDSFECFQCLCLISAHICISHSLRSYHNMSPLDPWKWKWSNVKWNVKCEIKQKVQWNSSNGQLHWFPIALIICGNGPKGTKTMQTQTLFSRIGKSFWGIQGMPSESWRPGLSENVVVFVAIIF